ncbi:MAG TPA: hypothetical protein V6C57_25515 [Coleofasciculaceae cyanobacterium]
MKKAQDLGKRLFKIQSSDYRIDTPRASSVWQGTPDPPDEVN